MEPPSEVINNWMNQLFIAICLCYEKHDNQSILVSVHGSLLYHPEHVTPSRSLRLLTLLDEGAALDIINLL